MGKVGSRADAEDSPLTPHVELPMPDRDVSTIGDLIYYRYAKIIAKSSFGVPEGREAKGERYGFGKERFRGKGGEVKSCGGRRDEKFSNFLGGYPLPSSHYEREIDGK